MQKYIIQECPPSLLATQGNIEIWKEKKKKVLFLKSLLHDFFLFFLVKPSPPENVTFFWKDDTVTITCNKPKRGVKCLRLELQYKSKFDNGWQVSWT